MELLLPIITLKDLLPLLAIIAGIFVIITKNAIISVFNLIVLYILVAFYLIYIGITYIGVSYIIIYIGAIAILFLFIIMMIDVEVVEKRNNNYLPLLFLLLSGFLFVLKKILYNIGLIKEKTISFEDKIYEKFTLFSTSPLFKNMKEDSNIFFSLNTTLPYTQISYFKDDNISFENSNKNYISFGLEKHNHISSDLINLSGNDYSKSIYTIFDKEYGNDYLLIAPDWDTAVNRITQISGIGDVLYTVYHSYIYILSVILLLGMVGAIILTSDSYQEVKVTNIIRNKKNSVLFSFFIFKVWYWFICILKYLKLNYIKFFLSNYLVYIIKRYKENIYILSLRNNGTKSKNMWYKNIHVSKKHNYISGFRNNIILNKSIVIPSFSQVLNMDNVYSENIIGNLTYFVIANLIIAILLLVINTYFSLSIKYLDKGGGFECGFTSFVQTRERFNIIFYRVSLLFLIFDLEIILAFPYTVIYQKNQNISKNNVIAFLYILIVGFIYELKEGALNIVKKAHIT